MSVPFSIFHKISGDVVRTGTTQPTEILNQIRAFIVSENQPKEATDYDVIADHADRIEDKVIYENNKRVKVKRSQADIKSRRKALKAKEPNIPTGEQRANITNDQLSELLARIEALENKE